MKLTALTPLHRALGARMTEFAGYSMPLMYAEITTEHRTVREQVGIFDLCHMGRVRLLGPDAQRLASRVQTNDVLSLPVGRTRYALLCQEDGGIIDDVLVSREEGGAFLFVVNAANRETDIAHFREQARDLEVEVRDDTESEAMVAVQGPRAVEVMEALGLESARDLRYYHFRKEPSRFGPAVVSRTGYTGEVGFEILVPADKAQELFREALERGRALGIRPCGLGCRDTLRLEAGMPLYGHEIDRGVNPFEAGLQFAVKFSSPFVGREALRKVQERGPARLLVGLVVEGRRIPRQGHVILEEGREVGQVCSGTFSPVLRQNIATALVTAEAASGRAPLEVVVRTERAPARRVPLPFYRRPD